MSRSRLPHDAVRVLMVVGAGLLAGVAARAVDIPRCGSP